MVQNGFKMKGPKKYKIVQNGPDDLKWSKIVLIKQNGSKCSNMVFNIPKLYKVIQCGQKYFKLSKNGQKWFEMILFGPILSKTFQNGP